VCRRGSALYRRSFSDYLQPGQDKNTDGQLNNNEHLSSPGNDTEFDLDWEPGAEEQDGTGSSTRSQDEREPRQVVHKRQAIRFPTNDKRRVHAQPAGPNLPIPAAAPPRAGSIIGTSYRTLNEMIPMMREILEPHVSPKHVDTFLALDSPLPGDGMATC
jgi:hypothetical protein